MNHSRVQQEYDRLASIYDQRWSFYVQASIQKTLYYLQIQPEQRVLDIGCGTGTLLQKLLSFVPETNLVGIDPSQEMLNAAKNKLPNNIELKQGDAEDLPFTDECFDWVITTNSFHYFLDPSQAITEAKRVLKTNGYIVITDWCHDYLTCRLLDLILRWFDDAHFRTYRSHQCQAMLEKAGFSNVSIEKYKLNWFWGMMTVKAVKE